MPDETARESVTPATIVGWWARHRGVVLRGAIAVMSLFAVLKLGDEFRRLLFDEGPNGAIDLKIYQGFVANWLEHGRLDTGYPPGSLPLLALLGFGWFDDTTARWLWGSSTVIVMIALGYLLVRESGAESRRDQLFVALMLLSMNAVGVTVGNGQIALHMLVLVAAPIVLLDRHATWQPWTPFALIGLLLSLAKPTISVPFFALLLVRRHGVRTVVVVAMAYVAVTLVAMQDHDRSPLALLNDSLVLGRTEATRGGYANLDNWLGTMGWSGWSLSAASIALAGLIIWLFLHRDADLWILLGVTAVAARLWMVHRVYDDVLIVLPMVALYRIARDRGSPQETTTRAGVLLAITIVAMLAPARLELLPFPWHLPFTAGHAIVWLAIALFLMQQARATSAPAATV